MYISNHDKFICYFSIDNDSFRSFRLLKMSLDTLCLHYVRPSVFVIRCCRYQYQYSQILLVVLVLGAVYLSRYLLSISIRGYNIFLCNYGLLFKIRLNTGN